MEKEKKKAKLKRVVASETAKICDDGGRRVSVRILEWDTGQTSLMVGMCQIPIGATRLPNLLRGRQFAMPVAWLPELVEITQRLNKRINGEKKEEAPATPTEVSVQDNAVAPI